VTAKPTSNALDTATGGPLRRAVVVANPFGLHMRPANTFAQAARGCRAAVTVWKDDKRADGKSPTDLLLLFAEPGTELILEVAGDDAAEAIGLLAHLLGSPGDEI
jgi:phosphotransferase system HPr (HPr) family protein